MEYKPKKIEKKWQKKWEENQVFETKKQENKEKFYIVEMYPYPSGSGLHVGHAFNYTIGDIFARFKIMNGFNVLHPMGFDSFGLPAENAAIKNKSHPKIFTEAAIENFLKQQKALGLTYDWTRLLMSHSPDYYKWDQWIFLKLYEKGLAYKKTAPINWCPKCNTVLANEQVHNGKCWRHHDTDVQIKHLNQWFFKTTQYANELYEDLNKLNNWPENIKAMQRNWIGKSHGVEINFEIDGNKWPIFTTRPDTIFGVTFMVISAQHPKLMEIVTENQKKEVEKFLKKANKVIKSTSEKDVDNLEKEGVFTGSYAINPLTKEKVPVYAGNFVVADYAGGMVMAVPAHDQRDYEFAIKYDIPIKEVIKPTQSIQAKEISKKKKERAYTGEGILINSEKFNGLNNKEAIQKISEYIEKNKFGKNITQFKLRDWLISRQRFWGTPIPIIYCPKCGTVPVPEKNLPIKLPDNVKLTEGENPLKRDEEFVNTTCPICGAKAKRETDTMDTFVNSSWYFLRYTDNKNKKEIFDKNKVNYWCPVDLYIGGSEHACMHLIYFRFYSKFLRDLGLLKFNEPADKLFNQGMVHAADGSVMSKSAGNVVDPLDMINKYSADILRIYLMSVASPDTDFAWSDTGIESISKFVKKVFEFFSSLDLKNLSSKSTKRLQSRLNKGIKEITADIENMKYNLAVIKLRQLFDVFEKEQTCSKKDAESYLKLISLFCPHLTEELWEAYGNKNFISTSNWPKADESKIDEKSEVAEELKENYKNDIQSVLTLLKIEHPKKITLIIAEEWKYDFISSLKEIIEQKKENNPGEIIKEIMKTDLKSHGQEITKMIPSFVKNRSKIPKTILTKKEETKVAKDSIDFLEKEFNCDVFLEDAQKFNHPKSKQALPGKPAFLIE